MAWGFRRSLKVAGPLRLNLSKSGLGVSLGIPGLHVGVGPRGRYVRGGIPGTGIYYRKGIRGPAPQHTAPPEEHQRETPWMKAVEALLGNDPERCLSLLERVEPGAGPALNIAIDDDVTVTVTPDECGVAVVRAEALDRLGRTQEALAVAERAARNGCHIAGILASELRRPPSLPG